MWWFGLGVLFFIWFIMNGDEFYKGLKEGNMNIILLHLLLLFPLGFIIYTFAVAPFIEMLWAMLTQ